MQPYLYLTLHWMHFSLADREVRALIQLLDDPDFQKIFKNDAAHTVFSTFPIYPLCRIHKKHTKTPRRSGAFQSVDKPIIKPHALKYITNTAENIFSVDRALIIS